VGETPKIADPLEALEAARVLFDTADDFTIGVEEEFAILDPATLDMTPGFERIAGYVAVMPGAMERCTVDGEVVRAPEGGFYGGWITSDIAGPFKGARGTTGW